MSKKLTLRNTQVEVERILKAAQADNEYTMELMKKEKGKNVEIKNVKYTTIEEYKTLAGFPTPMTLKMEEDVRKAVVERNFKLKEAEEQKLKDETKKFIKTIEETMDAGLSKVVNEDPDYIKSRSEYETGEMVKIVTRYATMRKDDENEVNACLVKLLGGMKDSETMVGYVKARRELNESLPAEKQLKPEQMINHILGQPQFQMYGGLQIWRTNGETLRNGKPLMFAFEFAVESAEATKKYLPKNVNQNVTNKKEDGCYNCGGAHKNINCPLEQMCGRCGDNNHNAKECTSTKCKLCGDAIHPGRMKGCSKIGLAKKVGNKKNSKMNYY